MTITEQEDESSAYFAKIASRVREMMERHGIGKREQAKQLRMILGIESTQSHRKISGNGSWTLPQIRKVATHFGEPPAVLVDALLEPKMAREAVLMLGQEELVCEAWIGNEFSGGKMPPFVAVNTNDQWRIYRSEQAPDVKKFRVQLIQISNTESERPIIAVVDDDKDSADTVCEYLNDQGFQGIPYYAAEKFRESLRQRTFDGFVIDWILGRTTAETSIEDIRRSAHQKAPIIVLTGELQTGKADDTDIARVIRQFDVVCFEKPTRLPFLAAELEKKLMQESIP
ncbi:MAG: helix-turn-helix domain-containing protein [Sulfuricaulis sp.]